MSGVESEFKFRARHRLEPALVDATLRELGLTTATATQVRLGDIYLDGAGMELRAAGFGLRLRVANGACTITCKGPSELRGALFVRTEQSAPWPSPTTPRVAGDLPPTLRDAVEPILLQRPLVPVLRLHTERELRVLTADGAPFCEVAIDATEAHGSGEVIRFAELELEVLDDLPTCERIAAELQARLQLAPAPDDKPTHALRRLGIHAPRSAQTASLAGRLLARLAALQRAESATRTCGDTEAVHDLRTAARRLQAVATAFADAWPDGEADWLRHHLRALARELGRVRDLDVLAAALPALTAAMPPSLHGGGDELQAAIQAARTLAHTHLVEWLRCPQRLADAQRFADLLRAPGKTTPIAREDATDRIATARARWQSRARTATATNDAASLHALRIATRDLRFLTEELDDTLDGALAKPARRLRRLQDVLGGVCDLPAMQLALLALAENPTTPASARLLTALGCALQQLHDATEPRQARADRAIQRAMRRRFLRAEAE